MGVNLKRSATLAGLSVSVTAKPPSPSSRSTLSDADPLSRGFRETTYFMFRLLGREPWPLPAGQSVMTHAELVKYPE
jgi:hypothetical protein